MKHKDITKEIIIKKHITYREYNKERCSINCNEITKRQGNYYCLLFDEYVDFGNDDEVNDDYGFKRCQECLDSEVKND